MKKILICGDSFAADWTTKYPGEGWPNLLAKEYDITNLAQAGCSEYKIYLQLTSVDLTLYDNIVVSHTSPYRVYVKSHPVHRNDVLHQHSDLIYTDVKEHSKTVKGLDPIIQYFEHYFDTDHAKFVHSLICEKIDRLVSSYNALHITNLEWDDLYQFSNMINFNQLFLTNRGLMNHYDSLGNQAIYEKVSEWIKSA